MLLMSVIVYVIGIVGNLAGVAITDRLGRRRVLLFSAAVLGVCMLAIGGLTARPTDNYVAATVFVWFLVPELKQPSLEEIDEMFAEGVSARAFGGHRCQSAMLEEGIKGGY
ncbi:hypothetical protein BDW66DRAFT_145611 [Aspergillus desertorum]